MIEPIEEGINGVQFRRRLNQIINYGNSAEQFQLNIIKMIVGLIAIVSLVVIVISVVVIII